MKRTTNINLALMRKNRSVHFFSTPLALAVAAIVSGCQPQQEYQLVQDPASCAATTELSLEACEIAYKNALKEAERTAPKYASRLDCETEFDACTQSSSGIWLPLMSGFMVAKALDYSAGSRYQRNPYYSPVFHYAGSSRRFSDKIITADGKVIGTPGRATYTLNPQQTKPKPTVTRTVSHGGFGSIGAAKSNWGGRAGGWGG